MDLWELTHEEMRTTPNLLRMLLKKEKDLKDAGFNPEQQAFLANRGSRTQPGGYALEELKRTTNCKRCGKRGHWARDCRVRRAEYAKTALIQQDDLSHQQKEVKREEINFNVTENNAGGDEWIIDSGASSHMSNNKKWFVNLKIYNTVQGCMVGDGSRLKIEGKGTVALNSTIDGKTVRATLHNVLLVPNLTTNLISVGAAGKSGVETVFKNNKCIMSHNGETVITGMKIGDGLFHLSVQAGRAASAFMTKEIRLSELHRVLGHASEKRIRTLMNALELKVEDDELDCPDCPEGKGRRVSHPNVGARAISPGVLHVDLSGIVNKESLEGHKYYLLCKDEDTEFTMIYFCKEKSRVPLLLARMIIDFEILSGHPVREIHSDNGSEFLNKTTELLFLKERIKHVTSAPYCPQQNGRIEREMRTITEAARTILKASALTTCLWVEALHTSVYLKNRLPTSRSSKTPLERLTGRKPAISHLVEFGAPVHIIVNSEYLQKWDARTKPGFVVGFTQRSNTYKVFLPSEKITIECCDVVFASHRKEPEDKLWETQQDKVETVTKTTQLDNTSADRNGGRPIEQETDSSTYDTDENYKTTCEGMESKTVSSTPHPLVRRNNTVPTMTPGVLENFLEKRREKYMEKEEEISKQLATNCELYDLPGPDTLTTINSSSALTERSSSDNSLQAQSSQIEDDRPPLPPPRLSSKAPEDQSALIVMSDEWNPKSFSEALQGQNKREWLMAVNQELEAHSTNKTWTVVKRPAVGVSLTTKWIFTVKRDSSGNVERFKARLVARGFEQREGIDFTETFAPVARIESLRILLALSAINNWTWVQFDVATAFLNGKVEEEIYVEAPEGLKVNEDECLKIERALYGLKQSPRCWNSMFNATLLEFGFVPTQSDSCVYTNKKERLKLIIYVDDGLVIGESENKCRTIVEKLNQRFKVKELSGNCFLGIKITRKEGCIELNQRRYIEDILNRFNMAESNFLSTTLTNVADLTSDKEDDRRTTAPYREAIGCLQYLAQCTRPDLSFTVNLLSRFNQKPLEKHWVAVKHVLKYLVGTKDFSLVYRAGQLKIAAFSDADWAGDNNTRQSTSGVLVLVAGGPVIFSSRRQTMVAQSTAEAEYVAACEAAKELSFATQFLEELDHKIQTPVLHVDNRSAIRQIQNNETKRKSKHIQLKYHYIKQQYQNKEFEIEPVSSQDQLADLLTKPLGRQRLAELTTKIKMTTIEKQGTQNWSPFSSMAKLAVLMATILSIVNQTNQLSFDEADALVWKQTEYPVYLGTSFVRINYEPISPCSLPMQTDPGEHRVTKTVYDGIREECEKIYSNELKPVLDKFSRCKVEKDRMEKRLTKRFIDPISLTIFGGTLLFNVIACASTAAYSYFSDNSSYNRINNAEERENATNTKNAERFEEIRANFSRLEEAIGAANKTRDVMINSMEELEWKVGNNTGAIIKLSKLLPSISMSSSSVRININSEIQMLKRMTQQCKKGRASPEDYVDLLRFEPLRGIQASDTHIINVEKLDSNIITIDLSVAITANDATIYKVSPLNHWVNITRMPVFVEYSGPEYVLVNRTNNCKKGIPSPDKSPNYRKCLSFNYVDPRLHTWTPVSETREDFEKLIEPSLIKTATDNYIYCLYSNITVQGKTVDCPTYPFTIPLGVGFKLNQDIDHHVTHESHLIADKRVGFKTLHMERESADPRWTELLKKLEGNKQRKYV